MTLSRKQIETTKKEFQENLVRSQKTVDVVASELGTSVEQIYRILELNIREIEQPWILKNYLVETIESLGEKAVPFTALKGEYHEYWFLDKDKIENKLIE